MIVVHNSLLKTIITYSTILEKPNFQWATVYYVRVRAIGTGWYSNSEYSGIRSATTAKLILNPPSITVSAIGSNAIRVTWNPVSNASNYEIQYATNSSFTRDVRTFTTITTSVDITSLNPNTTYYIKVMACGAAGESNYSTVKSTTTLKPKLGAPTITRWRWNTRTIGITWTPVYNAGGYRIEYTTDPNFRSGIRTVTVGSSTTSREITGLGTYTTYYVRIQAIGTGFTDSEYSNSVWIRTPR